MRRTVLVAALAVVWLAFPAGANAARVAVGLTPGADARAVAVAMEQRTGNRPESLRPIPALLIDVPAGVSLAGIRGIRYVEPLITRHLAYTPNDPLVAKQWYLGYSGFYEPWVTLPSFEPIPVAVIDSGVDASHPDLGGRILDAESFVGGSAKTDALGHGTFVAGLIGAEVNNGVGIAGLAPSAQLLVAKVVTKSRTIPVEAEAKAIRWAVDNGAQVINMSLGGIRDPLDPERDTYSRLEADAVAYAVSNGVVVVAAVGNSDQAPVQPVEVRELSGGASTRAGRQRDDRHGRDPDVLEPRLDLQRRRGTGAPDPVGASTAVDLTVSGLLGAGVLELRPRGVPRGTGNVVCRAAGECGSRRPAEPPSDAAVGAGHAAAPVDRRRSRDLHRMRGVRGRTRRVLGLGAARRRGCDSGARKRLPERDFYETNDDLGTRAYTTYGSNRRIRATVDFWDDQDDVYAIELGRNQPVYVGLTGTDPSVDLSLAFWLPQARSVERVADFRYRVRTSARTGSRQYLSYKPRLGGTFYVQVRMSSPGRTHYRLTVIKG